jgi:hypothetical protein
MLQQLLQNYHAGNLRAVVEAYEQNPGQIDQSAEAALVVAQSYFKLKQPEKAGILFLRAGIASRPPKKQLLDLAFNLLRAANNIVDGLQAARQLLALNPKHREAATFRRHFLPYLLAFNEVEESNRDTLAALGAGDPFALSCELPWDNIAWCADEKINAQVSDPKFPPFTAESRAARRALPAPSGKIRIGYLSNDFSTSHATMILFRSVLEAHDSTAFETRLFCYTPPDLISRDEGFRAPRQDIVDIGQLDDAAAADAIRSHELDILVDLKGHTMNARVNLVNLGLAPVQVAFLGFPGSGTGVDCDYVIGDPIVTPDGSKPFYHEKFCRLPETYQPNDNVYRPLPQPMRRRDAGLPDDRFVFASFNAPRKISPEIFRAWMRILSNVPDSILWVMCKDSAAQENFISHASKAGIAEERIVFALPTGQAAHIARLQTASLALDTFPCNGHTTTSDKLWAGLPVVTLRGSHFASRVSESLLKAVGLPELVADGVDDYVALATRLARMPEELVAIRQRLADNRFRMPLFDSERFTRHLEQAYTAMAERSRRGELPDHMDISALPRRDESFRS